MNQLTFAGAFSLLLLTACAPPKLSVTPMDTPATITTPNQQSTTTSKKQVTTSSSLNVSSEVPSSWVLSGAIAARSKSKAWSASLNWLQQGAGSYQIRLFGPLGSGSVLIQKQGSTITFRDGPKTASSTNADELLKQQTGIRLPVNHLYYWVRGIPAPGALQSSKKDASNRLIALQQAGFTIDYLGYSSVGNTVLPSLIRLQGNGIFIKLVIKNWRI